MGDIRKRFSTLARSNSSLADQLKADIALHQAWNDTLQTCDDRLAAARSKVNGVDTAGDKFAVQAKLEALQVSLAFCLLN
jgi:hypothetical protein